MDSDLAPIVPVIKPAFPTCDTARMGSWGILPLCCGAMAGSHSLSWAMTMVENIDPWRQSLHEVVARPNEEHIAFTFTGMIKEWIEYPDARKMAQDKVERVLKADATPRDREAFESFFALSMMLNMLNDWDDEVFIPVRRCAEQRPTGWLQLFFATGLLVAHEQDFPWERLGDALIGRYRDPLKSEVRAVLNHYKSRR